jgi:short-subunit dehydrogenase
VKIPLNKEEEMIAVNITALVGLTKWFAVDRVMFAL